MTRNFLLVNSYSDAVSKTNTCERIHAAKKSLKCPNSRLLLAHAKAMYIAETCFRKNQPTSQFWNVAKKDICSFLPYSTQQKFGISFGRTKVSIASIIFKGANFESRTIVRSFHVSFMYVKRFAQLFSLYKLTKYRIRDLF